MRVLCRSLVPAWHRPDRRSNRTLWRLAWGILGLAGIWWLYPPLFIVEVQGASMHPTYASGQLLVATSVGHVKRGDVVIARTDRGTIIKRVAYVGGTAAPTPSRHPLYTSPYELFAQPGRLGSLWRARVPAGKVYLLGDNLENSDDSRDFGPIPAEDIKGMVISKLPLPHL